MAAYKTELSINTYFLNLCKCFLAAFVVRASACTVNDIFDRKMDAGVGESRSTICSNSTILKIYLPERTKNRPLASGRISVFAAALYLTIQYLIGIAMFLTLESPAYVSQCLAHHTYLNFFLSSLWVAMAQLLPMSVSVSSYFPVR